MKISTIDSLCCPFCSGKLKLKDVNQENEYGIHFGSIDCHSCQLDFPIVAGVLILGSPSEQINVWDEVSDRLALNGVRIGTLCDAISAKNNLEAFSLLLTPSGKGDLLFRPKIKPDVSTGEYTDIPRPTRARKPLVPVRIQWLIDRYSRGHLQKIGKYHLAQFLLDRSQDLTATDVTSLFYGNYSRSEMANYFMFRFGQPRHLAALAIASIVKERSGPILDLACGMGHLTHYFAWDKEHQRKVIGIDRDYFRLYVAKNFMVPEADFICQWVDRPLPFPAASFDNIFCSDAFHYFLNKASSLREMERILSADGLIAISRLGNLDRQPHEGYELTVDEYARLFGNMQHVLLGEDELIDSYLKKHRANLEPREISAELRAQKWLSVVMSKDEKLFCDRGNFSEYPHSVGHLIKNPIYASNGKGASHGLSLDFEFPSDHFAFEDRRYQSYAPQQVDISADVLSSLEAQIRTNELEDLIAQLVLIGVPRKFIPTQLTK
jgi:ubiquinone/menaquinone biosynthesis C-methylase UbiE/uncharacterized protein YbaR (Trm112 family)